jgi:hypothetical protein
MDFDFWAEQTFSRGISTIFIYGMQSKLREIDSFTINADLFISIFQSPICICVCVNAPEIIADQQSLKKYFAQLIFSTARPKCVINDKVNACVCAYRYNFDQKFCEFPTRKINFPSYLILVES